MIIKVDDTTLSDAALIHSESWKASHSSFCSEDFVNLHTPERQYGYLKKEIESGKQLFMLIKTRPVGIVSVHDSLIENLYVLPSEQRKGYGTELLLFSKKRCDGCSRLWVLDNNVAAIALYMKNHFVLTGNTHRLNNELSEVEMLCSENSD